jgi:hypothetical protein
MMARGMKYVRLYPLGGLEFSGRMPMPSWNGSYEPQSRDVVVNAFRSLQRTGGYSIRQT